MAKNTESTNAPQSDSSNKGDGGTAPSATGNGASGQAKTGQHDTRGHAIAGRKGQFLIAPRRPQGIMPMGFVPLQFSVVEQTLRSSPDIEIVDTVGPKNIVGVLADGFGEAPSVLVARMTEQKAGILAQQAQGRLIVERDQALVLADVAFQPPPMVSGANLTAGPVLATVVIVLGKDNVPVKGAEVYLFGSMLPATGVTDDNGKVTLSLFGETPQSIRGLYVKPKSDYWSFYQPQPEISTDEANVVGLRPLSDWPSLANFPTQQVYGWGQKTMRLDQLPGNYRGQGVRVAVIDSGVDNGHDDLRAIRAGFDVINKKTSPDTWNVDTVSHGSHCAGVIAGADNGTGVHGFAPDAEIHACKLFPGGQVSQLIDALEYCIEKQVDVVNLSLGGAEPSEALEQQILRAKRAGIACIVAAGNSGGRVQYPASSPNVLAVSAIGKFNEFPPDSYHTQTASQLADQNGYFAASFSCFGPEIGVCAPGVAVASSVPPNNYAAWDGTSMAAPHITGLAALVLAHHPDFQGPFKARSAERVERLFQVLRMSARPVHVGDASRTGFGLPDVPAAVGLQPMPGMTGAGLGTQSMSSQRPQQGANLGGLGRATTLSTAGLNPFAAFYADQAQFNPQGWAPNPWGQPMQSGGQGAPAFDPYAAYFFPYAMPSQAATMQGFGFGMNPGYGRQGW